MGEGGGEGAEFLSKGHGHGVHQVGPSRLDDPGELLPLALEGVDEATDLEREDAPDGDRRHVQGGGKGVVGGLSEVHVVVGIDCRPVAP